MIYPVTVMSGAGRGKHRARDPRGTATVSAYVPEQERVRQFFSSGAYLDNNSIISVRAGIVQYLTRQSANASVLDLGCGDGSVSLPLLHAGNRLTLVDSSPHMLSLARAAAPRGASVEFVQSDVLEFALDRLYDIVLCIGLLAHVASVEGTIALVGRAVKTDGLCIIQITDNSRPLGYALNQYYRVRARPRVPNRMSRSFTIDVANRHGLTFMYEKRYGLLLPGLSRLPAACQALLEKQVASSRYMASIGAESLMLFTRRRGDAGAG